MKKWNVALLFLFVAANIAVAQSDITLNVSNPYSYDYLYHNPAGLAYQERFNAALGMQLLHSGITNDKLQNNMGYLAFPITQTHALGLRAAYFTSELFQRGEFSFLFGERLFDGKFSFGFNANLVTFGYDESKFLLAHAGDPLIGKGTAKNVFSVGTSFLIQPSPLFSIGGSFDHLNRPDISIDNSGFEKQVLSKLGVTYFAFPFAIQVDAQYDGYDLLFQGGLRSSFLDKSVNVFAGYSAYGARKNGAFIELNYLTETIGVSYQYQYPLNELNLISNGSHWFSLLFQQRSPGIHIDIFNPADSNTIVENGKFRFAAKAMHPKRITRTILKKNKITVLDSTYQKNPPVVDVIKNVNLNPGRNEIELIAYSGKKSKSEKVRIEFLPKPQPPKIKLINPRTKTKETNTKLLKLEFIIDGVDSLSKIWIIINGDTIEYKRTGLKTRGNQEFQVSQDVELKKGENRIKLVASNQSGFANENLNIVVTDRPIIGYRETWAVVIGINRYTNPQIPGLDSAVSDAKKIAKTLKDEFGFDHIITLYNEQATKDRILTVLEDSLKNVQPDDGVVIYFAGHGDTEDTPDGNLGYIIPYDGVWKSYRANISMGQIRELSQKPKAKHILYILDSCFSGLLLTRGPGDLNLAPKIPIQDLFSKNSRYVLTAGRKDEEGIDGILAKWLLQGIHGDADNNKDGFISASELGIYIRLKVRLDAQRLHHQQTPQFGQITADDGEFVFIKKKK